MDKVSPRTSKLFKSLEELLCPDFLSTKCFHDMTTDLLKFLRDCTHLHSTGCQLKSSFISPRSQNEDDSNENAGDDLCLPCLEYTVADMVDLTQFPEITHCSNWKYTCVASDNLIPNMAIIGILTPQKDGTVYLKDRTGHISCVFFSGSESLTNCPVDHKEGLSWSIGCLVAVTQFWLILEKRDLVDDQVYLIVNENSVIPLTEPLSPSSAGISCDLLQCFNDLSITEKVGTVSSNENISGSKSTSSGKAESLRDISTAFNTLSLNETEPTRDNKLSSGNAALLKTEAYICQLIILRKKTLPYPRKTGTMGFRLEVLIVSNIFVEDFQKIVCHDVSDDERRVEKQALDFSDTALYGTFRYNMVYVFKRPVTDSSSEHLKKCVSSEICTSVVNVTDKCLFIPFMKSPLLCRKHNPESSEVVLRLQDSHFRLTKTACLCSVNVLDKNVCTVSDLYLPKFASSNVFVTVQARIESKEYKHHAYGSDLKLILTDSSSKIDFYLKYKHSNQHLHGLLPGSEIVISNARCRCSENDNLYLEWSHSDLGLQLIQYFPVPTTVKIAFDSVPILPEERRLPMYFFSQLAQDRRNFRSVSFIIRISSLSINPNDASASKACFLADDGSEQRYINCKGLTVAQLLGISPPEWHALLHLARSVEGELSFRSSYGSHSDTFQTTSVQKQFLSLLCQHSEVHRQMVLLCSCTPCDSDYFPGKTTRVFCNSMSDAKSVKLSVELLRHVTSRICT